MGTTGAVGVAGVGTTSAQSGMTASNEAVETASSVPCVDHWRTIESGDICYVAAGICLLIPTPAGSIAAKGCVVSGGTCFALETLERIGCGDGEVHIYEITCPVPGTYEYVAVPDCVESISETLMSVLDEYLPWTPWVADSAVEIEDTLSDDWVEVESDGEWVVSEEFVEEYLSDDDLDRIDTD